MVCKPGQISNQDEFVKNRSMIQFILLVESLPDTRTYHDFISIRVIPQYANIPQLNDPVKQDVSSCSLVSHQNLLTEQH